MQDPLELEFRMVVSLHMGAIDQTWVLCKAPSSHNLRHLFSLDFLLTFESCLYLRSVEYVLGTVAHT